VLTFEAVSMSVAGIAMSIPITLSDFALQTVGRSE
jgi:hypothetical protein